MTNEITIRHMEHENFYIDRTGTSLYSTGLITIDWGDGTTETTHNNIYSYSHNYYNFTHDNEGYETYSGYITVTISGVEEIRDGFLADANIEDQYVDAVTIPDNITSIGDDFCYNKIHLHYLTLSNSLTSIGDNFCYMCYLSNGLELPNSLTSIGDNFCNVSSMLSSLALPNNITTIGDNFCAESGLTSFFIPRNIISIGNGFLNGCSLTTGNIIIPNNVENIGDNFLQGCGITNIIFENNSNIDAIPNYFANNCLNLTNIVFPDNLESIGTNFCCNCESLTRVEFPEGLIELGENFLNGESQPIHLVKLIFPSSFTDLVYGLQGSYVEKIIFKSTTPIDMNNYPELLESAQIYVPKNYTTTYANAYIEANGDAGEGSPADPNYYHEILTLPEALTNFGALMRTKLAEKKVSSNVDDGLTTLVNKVKDIQPRESRTGFFADIGFYDPSTWSNENAFKVVGDTLVFNEEASFNFIAETLPNTFTIGFVVTLHNNYDAIQCHDGIPMDINFMLGGGGDNNIIDTNEEIKMTFETSIIISRQNGGQLELNCAMSGDTWSFNNINFSIQPDFENNSYITISELFYSSDYYNNLSNNETPYETIEYFSNWLDSSMTRDFPVILKKDDEIIQYYDTFIDMTDYSFLWDWEAPYRTYNMFWEGHWPDVPMNYRCRGAWHFKLKSDTSTYEWITTDDLYYPVTSCIRLKGKGDHRIDTYIPGNGKSWEEFAQYTTILNEDMPQDWLISFDYTYEDSTQNKDFYIQIGADNNNCVKLGVSGNNIFLESNTGNAWNISNNFDTPLNITLYTRPTLYYGTNGNPDELHITYWLCINEYKNEFETSWQLVENQTTEDILVHNLYKVVQNDNVDITNLMYMYFNIRNYEPPL